jgi:hypothetical protein
MNVVQYLVLRTGCCWSLNYCMLSPYRDRQLKLSSLHKHTQNMASLHTFITSYFQIESSYLASCELPRLTQSSRVVIVGKWSRGVDT